MLIQICCSVDSHYFIKKVKELYPQEKIIGYFYDPNIHPFSEFELRYLDVKRSCKTLGIELIKGEYEYEDWLIGAKGLEDDPEKGSRCEYCFDFRMDKTAQLAKELKEKIITTTLLMSPKKSHLQLMNSLQKICCEYDLDFIAPDFRKNNGTKEQFDIAKKDNLYHQNYCGCIFALQKQKSVAYELMSPINNQILPSSIEERIKNYSKYLYENKNTDIEIIKEKFLNYRLLSGLIKFNNIVLPSYFLFYSHFQRNLIKFEIDKTCDIFNSSKEGIKILSIKKFNELANTNFKNIYELNYSKMDIESEINLRNKIDLPYSLSPIIIVDKIIPSIN